MKLGGKFKAVPTLEKKMSHMSLNAQNLIPASSKPAVVFKSQLARVFDPNYSKSIAY